MEANASVAVLPMSCILITIYPFHLVAHRLRPRMSNCFARVTTCRRVQRFSDCVACPFPPSASTLAIQVLSLMTLRNSLPFSSVVLAALLAIAAPLRAQTSSVLLDTMTAELNRATGSLGKDSKDGQQPPY